MTDAEVRVVVLPICREAARFMPRWRPDWHAPQAAGDPGVIAGMVQVESDRCFSVRSICSFLAILDLCETGRWV